jgi:hypothetical protein
VAENLPLRTLIGYNPPVRPQAATIRKDEAVKAVLSEECLLS